MTSWIRNLTAVMLVCGWLLSPSLARADPDIAGTWLGKLSVGEVSLRVAFNLKHDAKGAWSGTLDSPDQNAYGIAIDTVKLEGTTLKITIAMIQGSFEGQWQASPEQIIGTWTQVGRDLPLTLTRSAPLAH